MKHPPDCQLSSAWLHRNTEWYDTTKVPGVSFDTMVGKLVSIPLPSLISDYLKYNFRKSWVRCDPVLIMFMKMNDHLGAVLGRIIV